MAWEENYGSMLYDNSEEKNQRRNKMEVKGKILAKKGDNKAFKLDDGSWYNLNDNVIPYLEKMNKGDEIVVTFEKKGTSRYVSKLVRAGAEARTTADPEPTQSTTGFACEDCGKELKDGRFKKCFVCNKKNPAPKKETSSVSKSSYDNPEKTAQIQRGNALNAAASVAGGCAFSDPDTARQFVLELADSLLEWLRAE
jgi:hypothetical protein